MWAGIIQIHSAKMGARFYAKLTVSAMKKSHYLQVFSAISPQAHKCVLSSAEQGFFISERMAFPSPCRIILQFWRFISIRQVVKFGLSLANTPDPP